MLNQPFRSGFDNNKINNAPKNDIFTFLNIVYFYGEYVIISCYKWSLDI